MLVERLRGGPWGQNCFLVAEGDQAVLVDPGGRTEALLERLASGGLRLVAIINTHGHFDHIGAVHPLVAATSVPFYISAREVPVMKTTNMMRFIFKSKDKVVVPTEFVDLDQVGGELTLGGIRFECIPTPGHTPGGHCFRVGGHLFSGDTVLRSMPGSAELPGGNAADLERSLALLATLPRELILHAGHGDDTTLGETLDAIAERTTEPAGGS